MVLLVADVVAIRRGAKLACISAVEEKGALAGSLAIS
jgi:hypothetical protein